MKIFNKTILFSTAVGILFSACNIDDYHGGGSDDKLTFNKIGSFVNGTGDEGFAEISAFDPYTNKLFVVNPKNSELSVWDISNPRTPVQGMSIVPVAQDS